MNRLNQTESAVFKLWILHFQMIYFYIIQIIKAVVLSCGGPKSLPVHRYYVIMFTFSGPMGCKVLLFVNRVALNTGLGVRDVASALS